MKTTNTFASNSAVIVKCTMKYAKAYLSSFTSEKVVMDVAHKTEVGNLLADITGNVLPNAFYNPSTNEYIFNHAMLRMPKKFVDIVALHEKGHKVHGHVGGKRLISQELEADKYALDRTTNKEAIEFLIGFVVFNAIAPLTLGAFTTLGLYNMTHALINLIVALFLSRGNNLETIARVEQALTYLRK